LGFTAAQQHRLPNIGRADLRAETKLCEGWPVRHNVAADGRSDAGGSGGSALQFTIE